MRAWTWIGVLIGVLSGLTACGFRAAGTSPELLLIHAQATSIPGCAAPATHLSLGLDINGNNWIDPDEPTLHRDHCAASFQLQLSAAPSNAQCAAGGIWIASLDGAKSANASLSSLWCHVVGGLSGHQPGLRPQMTESLQAPRNPQDSTGLVRLVRVDPDVDGLCPVTGRRVASGLDSNRNGRLDADETLLVQHLCGDAEPAPMLASGPDTSTAQLRLAMQLPAHAPFGQVLQIQGPAGESWRLQQRTGQRINTQLADRTLPAMGSDSTHRGSAQWQLIGPDWPAIARAELPVHTRDQAGTAPASAAQSADGQHIVLARNDGLWLSRDGGLGWQRVGPDALIRWTAVSSSADGQRLLASSIGDGLYGSHDGGRSWQHRSIGTGYSQLASSADGQRILAVRYGTQLWASLDAGEHWQRRGADATWKALAVSGDGAVMAAAAPGLAIQWSNDGGTSWKPSGEPANFTSLALSRDGRVALAGTSMGHQALQVSRDGGLQWAGTPAPAGGEGIASLAVSSSGARWLVADAKGQVWQSPDHGLNWQGHDGAAKLGRVALSPEGLQQLALSNDGQLYRSTSATTPGHRGSLQMASGAALSLRYGGTGVWMVAAGSPALHAR